jgi:hypothetical protein
MTDEVTVDADTVTLRSGGRVLDTQRRDALARVYAVCAAADTSVTVTDVPLRVFRFDDRLWVLPWTTAGVAAATAALWPEPRQRAERCWEAVIDELPRDWRKLLGDGLRPQGSAVLVAPVAALPAWRIRREGADSHFVGEHAYPFLDALIAGWFHQKFDVADDTLAAAIASFRKETNADDWAETRADIERLLRRHDDTALAQEFIRLFRPGVDAAAWRGSARQWLTRIDELLRA